MSDSDVRLLILGAHPDDAEFHAGGLITRYRESNRTVRIVSVTNGAAGHHLRTAGELIGIRRSEARAVEQLAGVEFHVWDFPDGELQPTLEVRRQIIREIRTFEPDLVLTHRTNDYHPDHRAVAQAVQDASYMVRVPLVAADTPALRRDPVVAYMSDLFTTPCSLRPDYVLDVGAQFDAIVRMLACHRSQVFEWLPYVEGVEEQVPTEVDRQIEWLAEWYANRPRRIADRFRDALRAKYGEQHGDRVEYAEAFEISEYAGVLDPDLRRRLFPW